MVMFSLFMAVLLRENIRDFRDFPPNGRLRELGVPTSHIGIRVPQHFGDNVDGNAQFHGQAGKRVPRNMHNFSKSK
jgi:hypothetical protein